MNYKKWLAPVGVGILLVAGIAFAAQVIADNLIVTGDLDVLGGDFNLGTGTATSTLTSLNGNLGVGTTTPSAKLTVVGDIKTTGSVKDANNGIISVPSGFVGFFNLGSCPTGWSEFTQARGRYPVGMPSGGTLATTTGTALTNGENRASGALTFSGNTLGTHVHTIDPPPTTTSGASHTAIEYVSSGGNADIGNSNIDSTINVQHTHTVDIAAFNSQAVSAGTPSGTITGASAVAGTNAPYIQLLICQKN